MYKHLVIDSSHNHLLCSNGLVGLNELVEVFAPDEESPPQACGKILRKIKDPAIYVVHASYEGHESIGITYVLGEKCVLKVLGKNRSGTIRRRFSADEKQIVNLENSATEKKVVRAKTGSVRKKRG